MQQPAFLPQNLIHYIISSANDTDLLTHLSAHPTDLIRFFAAAAEDETWSDQHSEFMRTALVWCTERFAHQKLSLKSAEAIRQAVQNHFSVLQPYIPYDITVQTPDKEFPCNSLLFGVESELLRELLRTEYHEEGHETISLPGIPLNLFRYIHTYIHEGKIKELWKETQPNILSLLQHANELKLPGLAALCEQTLKRYITKDNALEILLQAHTHSWPILEESARDLLNQEFLGIRFLSLPQRKLSFGIDIQKSFGIEFLEFSDRALNLFQDLLPYITHIICSGALTIDSTFTRILQAPHLIGLDVSRSAFYSDRLYDIPETLLELDLSQCNWLTDAALHQVLGFTHHLNRLTLNSAYLLTYIGWGNLDRLPQLKALDISHCKQLTDADFQIIIRASHQLLELHVNDCPQLTDRSFFELTHVLPQLIDLSIAHTPISDGLFLELGMRCRFLQFLNISGSPSITDKGLLRALSHMQRLKCLTIQPGQFSDETIQTIQRSFPLLVVEEQA